jgi:hypothetical protein
MSREELELAIEAPARKVGMLLEEGLTERILDAVGNEPGDLPLLEFALEQIWKLQNRGQLTHAAYDKSGGVEQALSAHADQVLEQLGPEGRDRARRVFVQLVQPGAGTVDTRRQALRDEIGDQNWDLVSLLADSRLVVSNEQLEKDKQGHETRRVTGEVVHEALIAGWPPLRAWMEEDRLFRTWQERLRAGERQWTKSGHDEGALLRGFQLAEAEQWRKDRRPELTESERAFIEASAAMEQQAREEERRRRRRTVSGLATGFVFALFLLGLTYSLRQQSQLAVNSNSEALQRVEEALQIAEGERNAAVVARATAETAQTVASSQQETAERQRVRAENERRTAVSRQLSAQSTQLRDTQLDLALLLALEGSRANETVEA